MHILRGESCPLHLFLMAHDHKAVDLVSKIWLHLRTVARLDPAGSCGDPLGTRFSLTWDRAGPSGDRRKPANRFQTSRAGLKCSGFGLCPGWRGQHIPAFSSGLPLFALFLASS